MSKRSLKMVCLPMVIMMSISSQTLALTILTLAPTEDGSKRSSSYWTTSTTNEYSMAVTTPENTVNTSNESVLPGPSPFPAAPEIDYVVTRETYLKTRDASLKLQYIIHPLALLVTGINIVVFCQKAMWNSTAQYVVAISVAQIIYVLIGLGYNIMTDILQENNYFFYVYALYATNYGLAVFRRVSYVLMCFVSLERLYAIARPLHVRTFVLTRFPRLCIIAVSIFVGVLHFYIPARREILQTGVSNDGSPIYRIRPSQFGLEYLDLTEFLASFVKILFIYLTMVALILMNVLTLLLLKRHSLKRRSLQSDSSGQTGEKENTRQRQLTVTIMGATVSYVVLSLPFSLHLFVSAVSADYALTTDQADPRLRYLFFVIQNISYSLIQLSCFTDFFSFLLLSSAFRRTLLSLLPVRCTARQPGSYDEKNTAMDSVSADTQQ